MTGLFPHPSSQHCAGRGTGTQLLDEHVDERPHPPHTTTMTVSPLLGNPRHGLDRNLLDRWDSEALLFRGLLKTLSFLFF